MGRRAALIAASGAVALLTTTGALTAPATAAGPPATPSAAKSATTTATTTTATSTAATSTAAVAACGEGSYQAEAVRNGNTWTARRGGTTVYTGTDLRSAVQAAVNSLTAGRTAKERVVVRGSGSMSAGSRISLPSYTALDVCGTINVTGTGSGDQAPVYSRGTRDIEVQHLNLTGSPLYGVFLRNVQNVVLGQLDMRLSAGLGVRVDNRGDTSQWTRNVRIDNVYVSGASSHAVETYGVDGLTVGTVTARNVGESGLLLNQTVNATVTKVDADGAGTGTGYAAFRMANRNGRVGSSYPTNIRVGEVVARGGGRGVFCVSESGGAVIDRISLSNTGNNSILIENCYNVNLAAQSGTVTGGGEIRLAARSEFPNNSDITVQNLTVTNSSIRESPCGTNTTFRNITRVNTSQSIC
ncbi:hypothetical protein [Streptomyces resistomycificus]|uniref:Parallel beta-helix repeat-containing protein n=1 Tax=Streptomyces resistomycificus TaxID=67356 RepID=A0A0L8LY70_9ACTN|nr:hypothetical protein [Streptomyces resistomycificus]KOG43123.1 parallel beta-helix repeat-containing protein [Streptomyces resistomycificus]KUN93063.1 hypothetical protein AQJ84_31185 [Streptomyces resistomycificus]